ncbi:MAG: hypothetical protein A3E83_04070 [Gammaproteobacteria bacterium RIFCSPHIGHO2_12_FULL_41_20]|nr:MAG: hypothetical protein A3E83_04070 [Gammaproteobacteria bacterium RIFCSPHIGHO2_12_FULL_41_20]
MKKPSQLSRMCTVCGQQKPLSAFLQFGAQGATYGVICADCRGIAKPTAKDKDDYSTSTTSVTINTKTKVQQELDKKHFLQRLKNIHQKDKKKKEKTGTEKLEKTEHIEKAEKRHREDYIEGRKKESFLGTFNKRGEIQKQATAIQTRHTEAAIAKVRISDQTALQARHTEAAIEHEQRVTSIDLVGPYYDPQFSEIKYHSPIFQQFRTWLGSSAPITRTIEQMLRNKEAAVKSVPENSKAGEDPLVDYVNRNWGSTRRR